VLLKKMLGTPVDGGCWWVDGGGSLQCRVIGDVDRDLGHEQRLGRCGRLRAIRDSVAIDGLDFGLKAFRPPAPERQHGDGEIDCR